MTFVDSCILIDIFNDDAQWKSWSVDQVNRVLAHGLCINAVVYAEVSGSFATQHDVAAAIKHGRLEIKDIPMDGNQGYDVLGFIYEYLIGMFAANAGTAMPSAPSATNKPIRSGFLGKLICMELPLCLKQELQ